VTQQVLPISVVIPIRNESASLDGLFASLLALSPAPAEVIFVDTGSDDGSADRIKDWIRRVSLRIQLCSRPGAYPGAARNVGIIAAGEEWIAFLDAGIGPHPDWLGALWECCHEVGSEAIYGCCRFGSDLWLGRMLCAVSYGVDRLLPVLPASLFHRDLFRRVGMFEEYLRAGEDILWKNALHKTAVKLPVCEKAVVEYRYFSVTLWQAMRKQYVYEQCAALAGIGGGVRVLLLATHLMLYPALLFAWKPASLLLVTYLMLRGVVDPIRRSRRWWSSPWQVVMLPVIVVFIDLAGILGRLTALAGMSPYRREQPPKLDSSKA